MDLHHTRTGSGEPLVLIHGTGSYGRAWDAVVPLLSREREVWAIDLPGYGASGPFPAGAEHTARSFAAAVAAFLEAQSLERPHLGGNSLGGQIVLELAATGHAASATAFSPTGFWLDRESAFTRASLNGALDLLGRLGESANPILRSKAGRTVMFGQLLGRPWRMDGDAAVDASRNLSASSATRPTIEDALHGRFTGSIPSDVPVTVAWGKRDFLMPIRQGRRAPRVIPHARFAELPGCGHVPMTDDPELVARVLLDGSRAVG
jgi:pimeloyl-ACP methyl ester carboxylesterase